MGTTQRDGVRIRTRHLIWAIIFWWLLMIVAYFITTLRIDHLKNSLQDSGLQIIQELSNHVRIPLLERDAQAIRALLVDAGKKANVVYASVADHKNEIIAFAGGEQKLPVTKESARKFEQITFWEGNIANHSKIVSFASDIAYSGTKIGEIYLALPTTKAEKIRNQFKYLAIFSFLVFLFFIFLMRLRSIVAIPVKLQNYFRRGHQADTNPQPSLVTCPLCGTQKPFSSEVFNHSHHEGILSIKASQSDPKTGRPADSKGIDLSELAKRGDFFSIKRRVILRCAEIIQKLTA